MRRIAALIATLVLVGGCGTSESSLSDTVEGSWETDQYGIHIVFLDDGTYGTGHSLEQASPDDVSTAELEWGTWSVDGNTLILTPDPSSPHCAEMAGTYEIEVLGGGDRSDVAVLEDECSSRNIDFASGLARTNHSDE